MKIPIILNIGIFGKLGIIGKLVIIGNIGITRKTGTVRIIGIIVGKMEFPRPSIILVHAYCLITWFFTK